jgi:peptidoglycan/xylan/chitin deacetylase (PgdA/CDA1 family)
MAKIVYLTIDDGPSEHTAGYIDYLSRNAIPAVMFFVGKNILTYPEVAMDAVKKGIVIGNHTMNHHRLSSCSYAEAVDEIEEVDALIEEIYRDAECVRSSKVFRFPYGDKGGVNREKIQEYLVSRGFNKLDAVGVTYQWYYEMGLNRDRDVLWTFDFEDYKLSNAEHHISKEEIFMHISEKEPRWGGSLQNELSHDILLIHDLPKSNRTYEGYFTEILEYVKGNGVKFDKPVFI